MIVHIIGEGNFRVPDIALDTLTVLDGRLQAATDADDIADFQRALGNLRAAVHFLGTPLRGELTAPLALVVPAEGFRIDDVWALMSSP